MIDIFPMKMIQNKSLVENSNSFSVEKINISDMLMREKYTI